MGYDGELRLEWDDQKSALCKAKRGFSLEEVAQGDFATRTDTIHFTVARYPDQTRAVSKFKTQI